MQNLTIAINGKVNPVDSAMISVLDRGFLFADSVFEVFVGFNQKILDAKRHLHRLRASAEAIELSIPWTDAELLFELDHLASLSEFPKFALRLVVTRGEGLSLARTSELSPNRVIYLYPGENPPSEWLKQGIRLRKCALGYTQRGPQIKTTNYVKSIKAMQQAKASGFDDILFVNSEGEITESSIANVFFIGRDGDYVQICTPALASGLLPGITRESLIGLFKEAGISCEERIIYDDELASFDEAFLSSTVRGLIPIASIDSMRFQSSRDNGLFRKIREVYERWASAQVGFKVSWH